MKKCVFAVILVIAFAGLMFWPRGHAEDTAPRAEMTKGCTAVYTLAEKFLIVMCPGEESPRYVQLTDPIAMLDSLPQVATPGFDPLTAEAP